MLVSLVGSLPAGLSRNWKRESAIRTNTLTVRGGFDNE
jgi:hypothetical protein